MLQGPFGFLPLNDPPCFEIVACDSFLLLALAGEASFPVDKLSPPIRAPHHGLSPTTQRDLSLILHIEQDQQHKLGVVVVAEILQHCNLLAPSLTSQELSSETACDRINLRSSCVC